MATPTKTPAKAKAKPKAKPKAKKPRRVVRCTPAKRGKSKSVPKTKKKVVAKPANAPEELAQAAATKRKPTRKKVVRKKPICRPKKKIKPKPKPKPKPRPVVKLPVPAAPPLPPSPAPAPRPSLSPLAVYAGAWTRARAERLLWRAGFGPAPGQLEAVVEMGLESAVLSLTRPQGQAALTGSEPVNSDGQAVDRINGSGEHVLWWMDRMVRSSHQLVERMSLIWHDWFATSDQDIDQSLLVAQNDLLRGRALGSFHDLVVDLSQDGAMILWLNANDNRRRAINENYARELMELFCLGADRGAYTEADIRQLARALSGWTADYSDALGYHNFRWDQSRWDERSKTIFGQTAAFDWRDAVRLVLTNSFHPSFFVDKLWSYFIPTPPSAGDRATLERVYVESGYQVRPIVEAILLHPDLHAGPAMVKPPAVYIAGLLRMTGRGIDTGDWVGLGFEAGQRLFRPPNVSGWDESRWLDTSTTRGRWQAAARVLNGRHLTGAAADDYDETEDGPTAVARAAAFFNYPTLTAETAGVLQSFAASCIPVVPAPSATNRHRYRAYRQNALRQLIAASPDVQVS